MFVDVLWLWGKPRWGQHLSVLSNHVEKSVVLPMRIALWERASRQLIKAVWPLPPSHHLWCDAWLVCKWRIPLQGRLKGQGDRGTSHEQLHLLLTANRLERKGKMVSAMTVLKVCLFWHHKWACPPRCVLDRSVYQPTHSTVANIAHLSSTHLGGHAHLGCRKRQIFKTACNHGRQIGLKCAGDRDAFENAFSKVLGTMRMNSFFLFSAGNKRFWKMAYFWKAFPEGIGHRLWPTMLCSMYPMFETSGHDTTKLPTQTKRS